MWPFTKRQYPERVGSFSVYSACVKCDWVAPWPVSSRKVCPKCGSPVRRTVGRWIYKGKSQWNTDPSVPLRFEEFKD